MPYKTIVVFTYLPIYKQYIHLQIYECVCIHIYCVLSLPVAQKIAINQLTINDMKMRVVEERNQWLSMVQMFFEIFSI